MIAIRRFIYAFISVVLIIFATGCSDEHETIQSGAGFIEPVIKLNSEVVVAADVVTTTVIDSLPDIDAFNIQITDVVSGLKRLWPSIADYPSDDPLRPGRYTVEAFTAGVPVEGIGCPFFYGIAECEVVNGATLSPQIECKLINAMLDVNFSERIKSYFKKCALRLHSHGGSYIEYFSDETRPVFLLPGDLDVSLLLTMPDGTEVEAYVLTIPNTLARYYYLATVDMSVSGDGIPEISISFDEKMHTDDVIISLTPEFVSSSAPTMITEGFDSGECLSVFEGVKPQNRLAFKTESTTLKSMVLSVGSAELVDAGWPSEVDVLSCSKDTLALMERMGLKLSVGSDFAVIDITDVTSALHYVSSSIEAQFSVIARDKDGKESTPATVKIDVLPVDVDVLYISPAIVGVDETEITVCCRPEEIGNVGFQIFENDEWRDVAIESVEPVDDTKFVVKMSVGTGTTSVLMRVLYCGEVKKDIEIPRVSPKFEIEVDAYAQKAVIRINPEDESLREKITSMSYVYDGEERLLSVSRDTECGLIILSGLTPGKSYDIRATVMENPSKGDFCKSVNVVTERVASIPNGDFEDQKKTIEYSDMQSGGLYSQTIVGIFNQVNRKSFDVTTPRVWANTNQKTFCRSARNHNTWYMCPSVEGVYDAYSGGFAVKLQSVAWDLDGEEIPPYQQQSPPYVNYSLNVPEISYRAAGKMFLGNYKFDPITMTESYEEGVALASRPSALNGFYKYSAGAEDVSDCGFVRIAILGVVDGEEVTIAESTGALTPVSGYTAFSIPIEYEYFGVKATKMKIMISSTTKIGSIEEETAKVKTVDDPEVSSSFGSTLWVDQLSFSY